ncbi:MAG: FkbM family methyltransferase [Bacteroidota bacterium]
MNAFKRTFSFIHQHPLAKQHLFMAYLKWVIWQIKSRLSPGFHKIRFLDQTYFLAKRRLTGITGNIYTGLHEFEEMGFLLHFLRPEDVFFDIGANVGSYTLLASSVCKAKSFAFEPSPATFNILTQNIALNKLDNLVQLANKGVGKEKGILQFSANEDTTNHVIANDEASNYTIQVPIVPLNDYYPAAKPALIKIDVEGFETEVINGAMNVLQDSNLKAIIIELIGGGERYGYNENEIHKKLLSFKFKAYRYYPLERRIVETENLGESNTIYLRDLDFVSQRIKNAKSFKIFNRLI